MKYLVSISCLKSDHNINIYRGICGLEKGWGGKSTGENDILKGKN